MKERLIDLSVKEYVGRLSSKTPAPGGGSAAALTGALASGLLIMACEYSLKPGRKTRKDLLRKSRKSLKAVKQEFLKAVDRDADAFARYKNASGKAKDRALNGIIDVPLSLCGAVLKSLGHVLILLKYGNRYLESDVRAAAVFLISVYRGARENAAYNISLLTPLSRRRMSEKRLAGFDRKFKRERKRVNDVIESK